MVVNYRIQLCEFVPLINYLLFIDVNCSKEMANIPSHSSFEILIYTHSSVLK